MTDRTRIPGGTGEKMQYIAHLFNDHNVRFALKYPGRLCAETLRRATIFLAGSVDVLHASYVPGNFDAHWEINDSFSDEDCFRTLRTDGDPLNAAEDALTQAIPHDARTQLRCTLINGADSCAVVLTVSHLVADGSDAKYLLDKLIEAYNRIDKTGSADGLHVKDGSRAAEQLYRDMPKRQILSQMRNPGSGIRTLFPFADEQPGVPRLIRRSISAETMAQARRRAKAFGATANDLLLTACYRAYSRLAGVHPASPMAISSLADVRRTLLGHDTEGLCNLSGLLPTALPNGVQGDFTCTLQEITSQTQAVKQRPLESIAGLPLLHAACRLPMPLLLKCASYVYRVMSIGLTNMGNIDCAPLALQCTAPVDGIFLGPVKKKPSVQVSAASFDGRCSLCVGICCTDTDAALIRSMLDMMAEEIDNFIG